MLQLFKKYFSLEEIAEKESERLFLFTPVILGCGIATYFALKTEPDIFYSAFLLIVFSALYIFCRIKYKTNNLILVAITIFILGFFVSNLKTKLYESPAIKPELGTIWVRGTIEKIDKKNYNNSTNTKITLGNLNLWQPEKGKFSKQESPVRITLNSRIKQENHYKKGDYIQVKAILSPPEKLPIFPYSYDFGKASYFKQIGATGFTIAEVKVFTEGKKETTDKLKDKFFEKIFSEGEFTDDKAITYALVTGNDDYISEDAKQQIRNAGLGHILAVSGMHMSIVMAWVFIACRFVLSLFPAIALRIDTKKPAAIFVLIVGFYYLKLTDYPVSAERSYIMAAIFFIAMLVDRANSIMRPVAVAGLALLLIKPEAIFDAGFQMSFAAVASLIFLYEITVREKNEDEEQRKKFENGFLKRSLKYFFFLIVSSFAAGLATLPFSLYHFGRYSNYSVLANLLAIPASTYINMPFAFMAFLLMDTFLYKPLIWCANYSSEWLVQISSYFNSFKNPIVLRPFIPAYFIGISSLLMCWLFFFKSKIKFLAVPLLVIIFYAIFNYNYLPEIVITEKNFAIRNEYGFEFASNRMGFKNNILKNKLASEPQEKNIFSNAECNNKLCKHENYLIIKNPKNLEVNCSIAEFIINLSDTEFCKEKTIINKEIITNNGTHLIWPDGTIENVRNYVGKRPWNF